MNTSVFVFFCLYTLVTLFYFCSQVYLFEIDVYDENGIYGPAPAARPNPVMLRQMLGVNGIWGWGSGRISTPEEGAGLYAPVASYGRNYHNLNWDVYDPDDVPDYERMAQVGIM